ncbi:MAG TPA: serine/threonine-protein kinase, partial [Caldisericia bacterium]|nr:serine/threonine-protein kinase [Caldisericia bacterium]
MIEVGSIVGNKYKVLDVIGIGGMGTVFSAIELASGEKIAIKATNPKLAKKPQYGERFILEANIGMNLNHQNIVKIYTYGKEKDQYYLVMEYVDGFNLKQLIRKRGRIEYKQAIRIILQILSALSYAYHKGIKAHRDLKPENIIFDRKTGKVKITDFGIAKVEDKNITKGEIFYSPHYFAPEQFMPSKFQNIVDRRTDLFAVGVLFYEMITGKKPFFGETSVEIAKNQYSYPISPSILVNSIPSGISRICKKALSYNPEDRYQTPEEMAIDLKNGDVSQKEYIKRDVDYGFESKKLNKIVKEPEKATPSLLPYILIPSVIA